MQHPKYLVRPDDLEIFSLNRDNKSYSLRSSQLKSGDIYRRYKIKHLLIIGCYSIEPSEVRKFIIKKRKEEVSLVRFENDEGDEDEDC